MRLGSVSFGGPIASIALFQNAVCEKNKWLAANEFQEIYTLCKIFPGPVATEIAIAIGRKLSGRWIGGIISGLCFILPSWIMVILLGYAYIRGGSGSTTDAKLSFFLKGLQIGALTVIAASLVNMAKPHWQSALFWGVGIVAALATFFHPTYEPVFIILLGVLGVIYSRQKIFRLSAFGFTLLPLKTLFLTCFKSGAFVFGTGLAIVPVLESDFVQKYHWVTHAQFMDALAVGQLTPGPVTITATFLGLITQGLPGAFVATLGIYLPAFVYALLLLPLLASWIRRSSWVQPFYAWVTPAVIGGIAASGVALSQSMISNPFETIWLIGMLSIQLWKKPPTWLIIPGSGAGLFLVSLLKHYL